MSSRRPPGAPPAQERSRSWHLSHVMRPPGPCPPCTLLLDPEVHALHAVRFCPNCRPTRTRAGPPRRSAPRMRARGAGVGGGEATHVHIGGPPSTRGNDAATGTGIAPWGSPVTVSSGGGRSEGGSPGKPGSGGRGRASSERMGSPASLGVDLKERLRRARSSTSSRYDDIWGTGYGVFMPTGHFTPHTHARIASLHTPRGAWWE